MSPSLERGSRIVSVLAVYLYELIEHAPCEVEVFVAEVLAQDQKYLSLALASVGIPKIFGARPVVSHLYIGNS